MKSLLTALLVLVSTSVFAAEPPLEDDYSSMEKDSRRLTRGAWTVESGQASCTQDDELYKKCKDHGPALWYDVDFTDATIKFSYWADEEVQAFIFTVNGADGHVFRFVLKPRPGMIKAFAREGEPSGALGKDVPKLVTGEWVDLEVTLTGDHSVVKIGDYINEAAHPAITQAKTTIGLGFSFGTMKFKDFSIE